MDEKGLLEYISAVQIFRFYFISFFNTVFTQKMNMETQARCNNTAKTPNMINDNIRDKQHQYLLTS